MHCHGYLEPMLGKMKSSMSIKSQSCKRVSLRTLGTRGALSTEYFIRAGYAVIFVTRLHSLQPFTVHYR